LKFAKGGRDQKDVLELTENKKIARDERGNVYQKTQKGFRKRPACTEEKEDSERVQKREPSVCVR